VIRHMPVDEGTGDDGQLATSNKQVSTERRDQIDSRVPGRRTERLFDTDEVWGAIEHISFVGF
jgi:hypothetical protein